MPAGAARLFDTHCHLFEHGYEGADKTLMPSPGEELATYEQLRTRHHIERTLVVGYDEHPYQGNSDHIVEMARYRPWLVPLTYTRTDPVGTRLAAYPDDASVAEFAAQLRHAHERDTAPRIISLNIRTSVAAALADTVRTLTGTWFLIAHLGLPGPVRDRDAAAAAVAPLEMLAGLPNVSIKVSGQYAASRLPHPHTDVQPILDVLADHFGTHALVWGSDFSPCLDSVTFAEAIDCALPTGASSHERDAVLYANAARMFAQYAGAAR